MNKPDNRNGKSKRKRSEPVQNESVNDFWTDVHVKFYEPENREEADKVFNRAGEVDFFELEPDGNWRLRYITHLIAKKAVKLLDGYRVVDTKIQAEKYDDVRTGGKMNVHVTNDGRKIDFTDPESEISLTEFNRKNQNFEYKPNEINDADAYIGRLAVQKLIDQPDYKFNKNGIMYHCTMKVSEIEVKTTGRTQQAAKKAACAEISPLIHGKYGQQKSIHNFSVKSHSNINKCKNVQFNIEFMLKADVDARKFFEVLNLLCPENKVVFSNEQSYVVDCSADVFECTASFLNRQSTGTGESIDGAKYDGLVNLKKLLARRKSSELVSELMGISLQEHFQQMRESGGVENLLRIGSRNPSKKLKLSAIDINNNCTSSDVSKIEIKNRDDKIVDLETQNAEQKCKIDEWEAKFKNMRTDRNKYKNENIELRKIKEQYGCDYILRTEHEAYIALAESIKNEQDNHIRQLENDKDEETKRGDRRVKDAKKRAEDKYRGEMELMKHKVQQSTSVLGTQSTNQARSSSKNEGIFNAQHSIVKNENIERT